VQPAGDDVATVLVWVLSDWQAPQAEYVNEEQVDPEVQGWDRMGVPVQPAGDDCAVLVCVPFAWQTPQLE
jgi:hypothetical protein